MRGWRIICWAWVWGLVVAVWPLSTFAEGQLTLEMEAGWQGEYKGEFVPIKVKVSNRGPAVSGEVTLEPSEAALRSPEVAVAPIPRTKVELSAGVTKAFTMVAPGNLARSDTNIVLRSGQKVLASIPFTGQRLGDKTVTIGVLTDEAQTVTEWGKLLGKGIQGKNMRFYPLEGSTFPEQWAEWSGLNLIIVHQLHKETLTPAQGKVLQQWVANGGTLILNDGGPASSLAALDPVLPVTVGAGVQKVQAGDGLARYGPAVEQPIAVKESTLKPDGQLIAQSGSLPLLAKKEVGSGQVVYAGMDLLAPELSAWTAGTSLWTGEWAARDWDQRLLDLKSTGFGNAWGVKQALKQMPQLQLARVSQLLVWFALYLILVGPVIIYVLRKRGKVEWAWLILPAVGLVMTGALYLYGIQVRGHAVLVHHLGFVTPDAAGHAHVKGASALLSQERNDYEVKAKGNDGFIWPETEPAFGTQEKEKSYLSSGPVNQILFDNVSQWSTRDWTFDQVVSLGGNLTGHVVYKKGAWEGEVTNHTRYPLKRVAVMIGSRVHRVGDLKPDESRQFRVPVPHSLARGFINGQPFGYQEKDREYHMLMSYGDFFSTKAEALDVIGWLEEPLVKVEVSGHATSEASLYLVDGAMRLEPDEQGVWQAPAGVVPGRVVRASEPVFEEPNGGIHAVNNNAEVEVEYALPKDLAQVDQLSIKGTAPAQVYDWQANQWKPLADVKPATFTLFLSPDQRLRLKLDVQAHQSVIKPNLELTGRVKR
ncbi:DUF7408 domain-containing protein [Laceyella putida]|uniref:DUF4350 domain-containing protein n=1 Tax=Laceyella putida TaxID=110101 RepID=A0ABW2RQW9_9BACL